MPFTLVHVEAYAGLRANERPLAFTRQGVRQTVTEVIDRWYEGGLTPKSQTLDYFNVRTETGAVRLLRYDRLFDAWSILEG